MFDQMAPILCQVTASWAEVYPTKHSENIIKTVDDNKTKFGLKASDIWIFNIVFIPF